jgi:hypothetical protein
VEGKKVERGEEKVKKWKRMRVEKWKRRKGEGG